MWRRLLPLLLIAAPLLGGCARPPEAKPPDLGTVPDFKLQERSGRTVSRDDLDGKVWVAGFIFTRCSGPCPQVSATMARLQRELAGQPDFRLVTFTVDPSHDTPTVLTRYAEHFHADPDRWLFLTGKEAGVYRLIGEGFHLGVQQTEGEARTPGNEVIHSTRLALVDRQGHIRGYYDGRQVDEEGQPVDDVPRIRQAVLDLAGGASESAPADWPSFNAALNAVSACLLAAGFLAVRLRRITLHKACMLSALTVSAVFLASYLYYHLVVRGGVATRFTDRAPTAPDWVRYLYLAILLSHTTLAVIAAPLALVTAYLGLRDRIKRHMRLARWTLPIWMYVSVTGVVVYWMLYRLYPAP